MGIVHGEASYLPDFLDYFSSKFPSAPVKMEILGKKDIETTTMVNFYSQVSQTQLHTHMETQFLSLVIQLWSCRRRQHRADGELSDMKSKKKKKKSKIARTKCFQASYFLSSVYNPFCWISGWVSQLSHRTRWETVTPRFMWFMQEEVCLTPLWPEKVPKRVVVSVIWGHAIEGTRCRWSATGKDDDMIHLQPSTQHVFVFKPSHTCGQTHTGRGWGLPRTSELKVSTN